MHQVDRRKNSRSRKAPTLSTWMSSCLYELKKLSPTLYIQPNLSMLEYLEARGHTTPKRAAELYATWAMQQKKGV